MTMRVAFAATGLLLAACGQQASQSETLADHAQEANEAAEHSALRNYGFGTQVALDSEEIRCLLSNGFIVELLPTTKSGEFHLLVVDQAGEIIDPTWLRIEGNEIVEMETNGGIGSMAAVSKQFDELRGLPGSSVSGAPRCREPMKDGTL